MQPQELRRTEGDRVAQAGLVVQAVELEFTAQGREDLAFGMECCIEFLRNAWEDESVGRAVLELLTALARKPDTSNACELSQIGRALVAARGLSNPGNHLLDLSDGTGESVPPQMRRGTRLFGGGRCSKTVPADSIVYRASVAPSSDAFFRGHLDFQAPETLRFDFVATTTDANAKEVRMALATTTAGDQWADMCSKDVENTQAWANLTTMASKTESLLAKMSSAPSMGRDAPLVPLFGALRRFDEPQAKIDVDMRLEFPDVTKEYDSRAPDPMMTIVQRESKPLREVPLQSGTLQHDVEGVELRPAAMLELVGLDPENDPWLQTQVPTPPIKVLGWEEEVPRCSLEPEHACSSAALFASESVLAFERGDAWFEHVLMSTGWSVHAPCAAEEVFQDCVFALIGVPSKTFPRHEEKGFLSANIVRLNGASDQASLALLSMVSDVGNLYNAVAWLCTTRSPLSRLTIGIAVKENLHRTLLGHQRRVEALIGALAGEERLVVLCEHVGPMREHLHLVWQLFEGAIVHQHDSLRLLGRLHRAALTTGMTVNTVQRRMLESCLDALMRVVTSWMFQCTDASEFFQGPFLQRQGEDQAQDAAAHARAVVMVLRGESHVSLPFRLELPAFMCSRLRGLDSAQVALRVIQSGCILRLLRDVVDADDLFCACTTLHDPFEFLSRRRVLTGPELSSLVAQLQDRFDQLNRTILQTGEDFIRGEAEREQQALDARWAIVEQNRAAQEAVNRRFEEADRAAAELHDKRRKAALEGFRVAAEEAAARKKRQRAEQVEEERQTKSRDFTSPISEAQRKEAEQYLADKLVALDKDQEDRLGILVDEETTSRAALESLEQDLAQQLQSSITPVHKTSVQILHAPGGHSTMQDVLYGQDQGSEGEGHPRSSVRIQHAPGGEEQVSGVLKPSIRVHITKGEGLEMREALGQGDHGTEDDAEPPTAVTQPLTPSTESLEERTTQEEELQEQDHVELAGEVQELEREVDTTATIGKGEQEQEEEGEEEEHIADEAQPPRALPSSAIHDEFRNAARPATKVLQPPGGRTRAERPVRPSICLAGSPRQGVSVKEIMHHPEPTVVRSGEAPVRAIQERAAGVPSHQGEKAIVSSIHVSQPAGGTSTAQNLMYGRKQEREPQLTKSAARMPDLRKTMSLDDVVKHRASTFQKGLLVLEQLRNCEAPPSASMVEEGLEEEEGAGDHDACAPVDVMIEMGLVEPIMHQCRLVDRALVCVVLQHCRLVERLNGLKQFLLMAQGDLFHNVVERMVDLGASGTDYRIAKGRVFRDLLEVELEAAGLADTEAGSAFSYALTEGAGQIEDKERFDSFDYLEAQFELAEPLCWIVSDDDLDRYRRIHRFLLRLKYSNALIGRLWTAMCQKRQHGAKEVVSWLTIRWHQVRHLLGNFADYILTQLLHNLWSQMEEAFRAPVQQFESPQRLHHIHADFLRQAQRRCFLDGSPGAALIRSCIDRVMDRTVDLYKESKAVLECGTVTPQVQAAWREFEKTQTFLVKTVKVAAGKAMVKDTGPAQLLVHINFNEYF